MLLFCAITIAAGAAVLLLLSLDGTTGAAGAAGTIAAGSFHVLINILCCAHADCFCYCKYYQFYHSWFFQSMNPYVRASRTKGK